MNLSDILIAAAIAAIVGAAVAVIIRNRKNGSCSCGCEGCSKACRKKKNK
ncbi:MAG: FeoB-associated Cys-rich membrane protein [Clostridia bacterium]|nr:FeoB-associated Cys-rich membrane protein [Clostridia bacterium]